MTAITTESFPAIYAEYASVVQSRIRRYAIPPRDAADVEQEAWLLIWNQRARQQAVPLATFIAVKASDAACHYWRKHRPDMNPETVSIETDLEFDENTGRVTDAYVPMTPATQEHTLIVRDVLDKMKPRHAAALWRQLERGVEDHACGANQVALHRARRRFKAIWNGQHQRLSRQRCRPCNS